MSPFFIDLHKDLASDRQHQACIGALQRPCSWSVNVVAILQRRTYEKRWHAVSILRTLSLMPLSLLKTMALCPPSTLKRLCEAPYMAAPPISRVLASLPAPPPAPCGNFIFLPKFCMAVLQS